MKRLSQLALASLLAAACLLDRPCAGQQLLAEEETAFQAAVASVADSVVQIETFGGLERVGEELVAEGPTSGTIIDAEGWIVSSLFNFRQQPASILITLPGGERVGARIVARDFSRELVLLKVDPSNENLVAPPLANKAELAVGQWTIALGKTYDKHSVSQSVGIVSALGRAYGKAIQTDAKVSPINYGGPLIDLAGRVVGILSPISPGTFLEGDSSQLYDSGVGFAIPIEDVLSRLPRMKAGEDIHSGKLGIVTEDQNELVGPVRISGTSPGSPAAKAKLQAGDIIVRAGNQPVTLLAHLRHALGPVDAGQPLSLVIQRKGRQIQLEPTLTEKIPVYRRRYLGLRIKQVTGAGLQIAAIEPDSPASKSDLQVGETITHADDTRLRTRSDLLSKLAVLELDQPLKLKVKLAEESDSDQAAEQTAEQADASVRTIELQATEWPRDLPSELPGVDASIDDSMSSEIVDVVLGDFPNKAFAIIPPLSDQRELGLLVLFPEPGEVDRDKVQAYWSDFCRDYGWIVAIIGSGNPRGWSREEVELGGRVIGRLDKIYSIEKSRTVIGGLGIGGRIAVGAAASELQRVNGVMTLGTDLSSLGWRKPNSPMQSIDFLMVGEANSLAEKAEQLGEIGYAVNLVDGGELNVSQWETLPTRQIQLWLEGLGRL